MLLLYYITVSKQETCKLNYKTKHVILYITIHFNQLLHKVCTHICVLTVW